MASNPTYEFKKLNDLLSHSFNNIKHDVRELNTRMDVLRGHLDKISTDSLHTQLAAQQRIFLEHQETLNLLQERLNKLEERKPLEHVLPLVDEPIATKMFAAALEKSKAAKTKEQSDFDSIYNIPAGEVRITSVNFQAKGGREHLNGEWVEVTGFGGIDLTGYTLHDKGKKHTFKFPQEFKIFGPTKIFTGKGKNTNSKLYWKHYRPVWNDDHDVVTLRDAAKNAVSQVLSEKVHNFKIIK
ncbi:lamin tail domain-containing protein [Candidatus Woesearchaeota archaeon]|nr:lamin tail domain-containing protein [Candidatus Woesearchaeota archaeon]